MQISIPPAYLALPSPISTNNLFVNVRGRGRRTSPSYRAWRKLTADYLAAQRPLPQFAAPVDIVLYAGEMGVGNMDSDNLLKAPIDALKKAGVIRDDSRKWVRSSQGVWVPGMNGCVVRIEGAAPSPMVADVLGNLRPIARGLVL